ncbi:F0F1 ATP synthase subunit delta [Prevotella sp. kh1p2]|uniref:F0F1 ATP synthase subunit delta n=1 Tax=Prevotella sp. kh1p2 TaxID=1761883 RepID=UPI0008D4A078|nr:F0F1 ATP synthase subunit delta [Prevotella sp. kh1p2]SET30048.1 F-type H+-transporting ATPase subunit delta [Prevotella sp. kh1p2]SNU12561.1 F-type H+-transporting ATPase subunit delta [Prevotellaceae bacterium KH2P17]
MDIGVISVRYARALLKIAMELNLDEQVYQEMQVLGACYLKVPELRFTIDNPMLLDNKKQQLLETACGQQPSELTKKFISLVLKEGRENFLQFMAAAYITLYRKQNNITRGKLITAVAVSSDVEEKMRKMVEAKTQGTVEFNTETAPDIIGGFILEYDTYRMDASVKSQLHSILTELRK